MKTIFPLLGAWCVGITALFSAESHSPTPLPQAHSHNDYEQKRPLFDALAHGFCHIEADVHLVDGKLLVAHDRSQVQSGKTLQALYLDPLREQVRKNGGRVYRDGPPVTLLIDVKSEAEPTYTALLTVLKDYRELLTSFQKSKTEIRAITAIISGNRAREAMAAESSRIAAYDGRLEDLDAPDSVGFIPWISSDWSSVSRWRGTGEFPDQDKRKLREIVAKAHAHGRQVRFWGTPDKPVVWRELLDAGVDILIADDLPVLKDFLLGQQKAAPAK
ncbi:MAG: hypothetical protein HY043_03860 [Verrucomicrobia bacterium]|nr:hypothetical protein [Verrucomicrobiota bacterium]